jgi:glutamyl-tRNA reductase
VCDDPSVTLPALIALIAQRGRFSRAELELSCVQRLDRHAAEHLFRVAAGLDSMIFGESEIVAQLKQAYQTAQAHGSLGPVLHRLVQKALHCVKLLRSQTALAEGHASVGAVVAEIARQTLGSRLPSCDVLLWGAGKAAETSIKHLLKAGVRNLWIVNRTPDKARDLAAVWNARWLAWEQARDALVLADLALVCTQAPHDLLDGADVCAIMERRPDWPLALIDLAVPRNIAPDVAEVPGVRLWNIDDLEGQAHAAQQRRQQVLAQAEPMIRERVEQFWRWWKPVVSEWEVAACGQWDESSPA